MWPFSKKQIHPTFGEIKYSPRKKSWRGKYSFSGTGDFVDATVIIPGDADGPRDVAAWWPEFLSNLPALCAEAQRFMKQDTDNLIPRHRKKVAEAAETFTVEDCRVHCVEIPGLGPETPWAIEWAYPYTSPKDEAKNPDGGPRPKWYGLLRFEYQGQTVRRMVVPG